MSVSGAETIAGGRPATRAERAILRRAIEAEAEFPTQRDATNLVDQLPSGCCITTENCEHKVDTVLRGNLVGRECHEQFNDISVESRHESRRQRASKPRLHWQSWPSQRVADELFCVKLCEIIEPPLSF